MRRSLRDSDAAAQPTADIGVASSARRYAPVALTALFGLLYAYDLFESISNLLGVTAQLDAYNSFARAEGLDSAAVPWVLLAVNIALAPVAFGFALLLGRRRRLGLRTLILLAGLAVVAALSLSLAAFA